MTQRVRMLIGILTGFIALTAIGGGLALVAGAEGARFPLDWLRDTPFNNYTVPGLILAVIVGGSSLFAAVMAFTRRSITPLVALVAGLMMMGFIAVEVTILKQVPAGPTVIEIFYFTLGVVIAAMAWLLSRSESRRI